jgi:serine/threonine protein kinase
VQAHLSLRNNPYIATLYGVEISDNVRLVLRFMENKDLKEGIRRSYYGTLNKKLLVAGQICKGLEGMH